jgi:hypothetical protein
MIKQQLAGGLVLHPRRQHGTAHQPPGHPADVGQLRARFLVGSGRPPARAGQP